MKTNDALPTYGNVMHLLFSFLLFRSFAFGFSLLFEKFIDTIIKSSIWVSIVMKYACQYRVFLMKQCSTDIKCSVYKELN